jgi:NADPH:quinone reductase-like Zn-dependent oxidoreductase
MPAPLSPLQVDEAANAAAWLLSGGAPLQPAAAPFPQPGPGQIVLRNRAVALNPIDGVTQAMGDLIFPWIVYPTVLGSDCAGEVVAIGEGVTRFAPGDRAFGHAVGWDKRWHSAAAGAFQLHTLLFEHMASPLPPAIAFEDASVLPLALSTAAAGLFEADHLALALPSLDPASRNEAVLVWGASTSVGCNGVQLARAAGYRVFATASPANWDALRQLGASQLFDYRSPTVVQDLVAALRGQNLAGVLAIGEGSADPCVAIAAASSGARRVALASTPVSFADAPLGRGRRRWLLSTMPRFLLKTARTRLTARLRGVRTSSILGTNIAGNAVSRAIYADFLPSALAANRYQVAPPARIAGEGLSAIQPALTTQRTARPTRQKLVVRL